MENSEINVRIVLLSEIRRDLLNRLNWNYLSWSLFFSILLSLFIPSTFLSDGMGRYTYGFPLKFITIYQHEPISMWFFSNFFNGNAGLLINPLSFVINVFILYIIKFMVNKLKKNNDLRVNID